MGPNRERTLRIRSSRSACDGRSGDDDSIWLRTPARSPSLGGVARGRVALLDRSAGGSRTEAGEYGDRLPGGRLGQRRRRRAPTSPHVDIGVAVAIEFGALHGAVIVRRVDVVNTDVDARLYGVEFVDANSELSVGLCDVFVARHSELPQWRDPRYGTGAFPTQTFGVGDTAPIDAGALGGRWE